MVVDFGLGTAAPSGKRYVRIWTNIIPGTKSTYLCIVVKAPGKCPSTTGNCIHRSTHERTKIWPGNVQPTRKLFEKQKLLYLRTMKINFTRIRRTPRQQRWRHTAIGPPYERLFPFAPLHNFPFWPERSLHWTRISPSCDKKRNNNHGRVNVWIGTNQEEEGNGS